MTAETYAVDYRDGSTPTIFGSQDTARRIARAVGGVVVKAVWVEVDSAEAV